MFVNPGGPGGPGVGLATADGPLFQELVSVGRNSLSMDSQHSHYVYHQIGEDYDIIGFDPRGIGLSEYAIPHDYPIL